MIKVGLIGGDKREEELAKILAQKDFDLKVLSSQYREEKNITYSKLLKEVVKDVDVLIAPMSGTDEEGYLKATFIEQKVKLDDDFFDLLDRNILFFIGIARPFLRRKLEASGIIYIELAKLDDLAILNAIPTAEGAIKIAIEETPFTIHGSNTLVLGMGKVGLTLAWRLKALGAVSYAATRNRIAIARGKDLGINMVSYKNLTDYLPGMDIVFNTVPARILSREYLSLMNRDSLVVDLASGPGGTDFDAAKKLGIKALLSPGLPGKVAAKTAGQILGNIIPNLIYDYLE